MKIEINQYSFLLGNVWKAETSELINYKVSTCKRTQISSWNQSVRGSEGFFIVLFLSSF